MLDVTDYIAFQRGCSHKLSCIGLLLILVLGTSIPSVTTTDACNGRCRQFENVYCNSGTGVCDDCSIYCSSKSNFYNQDKCDKLCSKEPGPTDACANRCIDFPDTYCNSITGSCDSCTIFCSEASNFYNSTKCAIKCPGRIPTPTSTKEPVLSTIEDPVSTQISDTFTNSTTESHTKKQPEPKIKATESSEENAFWGTVAAVTIVGSLFVAAMICYAFYRIRRNRRPKYGPPQEERRYDGEAVMVVGQGNDTTPLNSLDSDDMA